MIYKLEFSDIALADIEKHKKSGDKAAILKLNVLLNELRQHPRTGTGQPKKLKHEFSDMYSRRINRKHRLVYSIKDAIVTVHVLSVWSHYGDK
jgi:toxin YoeB